MIYEIEQRIMKILQSIPNVNTMDYFVQNLDSVQLPVAAVNTRPFQTQRTANELYQQAIPVDVKLYVAPLSESTVLLDRLEAAQYTDSIITEFLSRPSLQYQDTGLDFINGKISVALQQDTSRPLQYPEGFRDGKFYWGAAIRITVPYTLKVKTNIDGDTSQ